MHTPLIIISGPSGVGKTTLVTYLLAIMPSLRKATTFTTRAPRAGEVHGKDYFFISPDAFEELRSAHYFIEANKYNAHWYGTPKSILTFLRRGHTTLIIPDINGANHIQSYVPHTIGIWLEVPITTLAERLRLRNTESAHEQKNRLHIAEEEMRHARNMGIYTHIIDMTYFDQAREQVSAIITKTMTSTSMLFSTRE